jgi:hypothetical protein
VDNHKKTVAMTCLEGAEDNKMTFPKIVGTLTREGFEGYMIDFRRAAASYYLPDGDCIELLTHRIDVPIAPTFDEVSIRPAIKEAQQLVPGYVSFSGRLVLYFGRTAETHVERFPNYSRCPRRYSVD